MKNHTKVYLKGMGYDTTDWIPCEVCQSKAVDIHHIELVEWAEANTLTPLRT
jgi:hypothetical protein